jgi:hypothetical protein
MKKASKNCESGTLTRRALVRRLALAGAAVGFIPCARAMGFFDAPHPLGISCDELSSSHAVISFHMDQPYVDTTGRAMPYHFPAGTRSGSPAASWSEEVLRSRVYQL